MQRNEKGIPSYPWLSGNEDVSIFDNWSNKLVMDNLGIQVTHIGFVINCLV